ncbi:MAG TPA: hypothetical protein DCO80_09655 [Ornithinibacillus sp.]|nr:hypothetical protein [Ornithinibacillus sp.]
MTEGGETMRRLSKARIQSQIRQAQRKVEREVKRSKEIRKKPLQEIKIKNSYLFCRTNKSQSKIYVLL